MEKFTTPQEAFNWCDQNAYKYELLSASADIYGVTNQDGKMCGYIFTNKLNESTKLIFNEENGV